MTDYDNWLIFYGNPYENEEVELFSSCCGEKMEYVEEGDIETCPECLGLCEVVTKEYWEV